MTFCTRASKHVFPKRSAKKIDGTEKPKYVRPRAIIPLWLLAKGIAWYNEFLHEWNMTEKISTWSGWPLRWSKRPPALSPPQRLPLGISIKIAPVTRVSRSPLCETMRKKKRLRRMLGHTRFCKQNTPWRNLSFFRALRPCDQDSPISVWKPSLRSMAVLSSRAQERRSREIRARSARERAAKPREK